MTSAKSRDRRAQGDAGIVWSEWEHFSRRRLFQVNPGLALPLEHRSFLSGDAGFGSVAVRYMPTTEGVLVSRRGLLTLQSPDLTREIWRLEIDAGSSLICNSGTALVGTGSQGEVRRVDLRSGTILTEGHVPKQAPIVGFTEKTFLTWVPAGQTSGDLLAIDRESCSLLWKHGALGQHTSFEERYLIQDKLATILRCLDAESGQVLWHLNLGDARSWENRRSPPPEPLKIVQGYPSVVVVGDRVLVVLNDTRVCVLAADSGEVLAVVRPGIEAPRGQNRPMHLITETSIFYLHAFGMVEFDHRSMKEVSRIDFRKEVEPHYARARGVPYPCAFWVSEESVIWTNMSGLVIGVSRTASRDGTRAVWADWMPGALVPVAQLPLALKEYIYVAEYGEKKVGLHCYKSMGC